MFYGDRTAVAGSVATTARDRLRLSLAGRGATMRDKLSLGYSFDIIVALVFAYLVVQYARRNQLFERRQ